MEKPVFSFHYSYSKTKPYQISCRMKNMCDKDYYFCTRQTPWDEISDCWEIKSISGRTKGEKATYIGKEISHKRFGKGSERLEADKDPKCWVMLRSKKMAKREFTLRYQLPFSAKVFSVKYMSKELLIAPSKELGEDGKIGGIEKASVKVTRKVLA